LLSTTHWLAHPHTKATVMAATTTANAAMAANSLVPIVCLCLCLCLADSKTVVEGATPAHYNQGELIGVTRD
jgi:hypothetical protein